MQPLNRPLKVSLCFLVFFAFLFFVAFNAILRMLVHDQTALRRRNIMRGVYLKLPIPMKFRAYFFNISNPNEVQKGSKPILKEIGPYCYDAWKEKIEVMDNEGEDSLSYTPYETYFFNQNDTGSLNEDDEVTILHPLVVGIVNIVAKNSAPLLPIINTALKTLFDDPQNIYLTVKVRDFLFEGITIKCNVPGVATTAVCSQVKTQVPDLVEYEKNLFKFSIFGARNGTLPNRFKVLRGIKKSQELGRLVELNHQKENPVWSSTRCNRFKGTDSWIYAPYLQKEDGFWIHTADLCRNLHFQYSSDATFYGIYAEKYMADLGDMSRNQADKCFCPTSRTCLPKGVMDLNPCLGVPIYATLPHFFRADRDIRKKVQGLKPEREKHALRLTMQPMLGLPLIVEKRLQFNLPIQAVKKIDIMRNLPELIHPIFWFEENLVLEGYLLTLVKAVFLLLKIISILKYCLFGASGAGVVYGVYVQWKKQFRAEVSPEDKISVISSAESGKSSTALIEREEGSIVGSRGVQERSSSKRIQDRSAVGSRGTQERSTVGSRRIQEKSTVGLRETQGLYSANKTQEKF